MQLKHATEGIEISKRKQISGAKHLNAEDNVL
jgi:hypothetical protein